jgi:hypothetical protein
MDFGTGMTRRAPRASGELAFLAFGGAVLGVAVTLGTDAEGVGSERCEAPEPAHPATSPAHDSKAATWAKPARLGRMVSA